MLDIVEFFHTRHLFAPNKEITALPSDAGIHYEELHIPAGKSAELHGYYLPHKEKTDKVFIYFHGNAENVGYFHLCTLIQQEIPINALIYDYRGYGNSSGTPTRKNTIRDAMKVFDFLEKRGFKEENISLYGRSLGGAVAIEVATIKKVKSLIIECSFLSVKEIAKYLHPLLPSFFVKNSIFNSRKNIKKVKSPTLFVHGTRDQKVPFHHGKELYELANEPKKLLSYKGGVHANLHKHFDDVYFQSLRDIML